MSKTNNNSRKNSKTTKNTAKKATRPRTSSKKNFKIENLEPRLMMDAATGFDIDRIDEYKNQFADVADSIANNVSNAVAAVTEFDVSNLGITQNAVDFVSMLGDTADQFKTEIINKVKGALQNAIVTAKSEIEAFNNTVSDINDKITKLDFSEFVNNYVQRELNSLKNTAYKGLTIEADGSKLVVTIDHAYEKSLNGMGFNLGSLGEIKMDGNSALSTAAKIQMSVDFNSDNDEYYFEDINDVSISGLDVQKLEARIQNLGLHATFMNMELAEQAVTNEQTPDLSMSFDGTDVSTTVDLEFTLENSAGLPFSFANGEYLKISNSTGELKVHVPDFQMKGEFSLVTVLDGIENANIPFLNNLTFSIGNDSYTIVETARKINKYWGLLSGAISGAVDFDNIENQFRLNLNVMKAALDAMIAQKKQELESFVDRIYVAQATIADEVHEKFEVFNSLIDSVGNGNDLLNKFINLKEGDNTITVFFTPKQLGLDSLDLGIFSLDGLDVDTPIALNVTLNLNEGKLSFGGISLQEFEVSLSKTINSDIQFNGFNVSLEMESLILMFPYLLQQTVSTLTIAISHFLTARSISSLAIQRS